MKFLAPLLLALTACSTTANSLPEFTEPTTRFSEPVRSNWYLQMLADERIVVTRVICSEQELLRRGVTNPADVPEEILAEVNDICGRRWSRLTEEVREYDATQM
jgi:hypothetical protein